MKEKAYHHLNLREELIEAGIKIMNEQGTEHLSLRKIAKSCEVSHNAPYRHFADKDELLNAIQKYIELRFAQILQDAVEKNEEESQSMISFGKAYVTFFVENPQYFKFFTTYMDAYVRISEQNNQIESNYQPFLIFQEQAEKHFEQQHIPTQYYITGLLSMWSSVHGLAGIATLPGVDYDGNWEQLVEKVLIGVSKHD